MGRRPALRLDKLEGLGVPGHGGGVKVEQPLARRAQGPAIGLGVSGLSLQTR